MNGTRPGAPLLQRLREELTSNHVSWRLRENGGPPESSTGGIDNLDLQVGSADIAPYLEVLGRLGFKEARPASPRRGPGAGCHLGYDGTTDRIVRVTSCFQTGIEAATAGRCADAGDAAARRPARATGTGRLAQASSGALIAVVGADGSGKSTALEALHRWLSPHFRVETIHLGKPRWSWITLPIKGALKMAGVVGALWPSQSPAGPDGTGGPIPTRLLAWRAVTARDRYRAVRRARRLAERGALVLCDRFPLAEVRTMDGGREGHPSDAARAWPARLLAKLEARYYASIARPDLLLVLSVPPDLALRRRPDDPEDRVRRRAEEVLKVDWTAAGACVVDTDRPLPEVHREMKEWIWARL